VSKLRIKLKYRGEIVRVDASKQPWEIRGSKGALIDWRLILVAHDLVSVPVVMTGRRDVELLRRTTKVPSDLRCVLDEALPPPRLPGRPGDPKDGDRELMAEHQKLMEDYRALGEREGLTLDSHTLFRRAHEVGLFGSLTLYDETRVEGDPAPVASYDGDLYTTKSAAWAASSCEYIGIVKLYEITNPEGYLPADQGRMLVLSGQGSRTDLRTLDPQDLEYPEGTNPGDADPPFRVVAAKTWS
jgi:hypothetical protein